MPRRLRETYAAAPESQPAPAIADAAVREAVAIADRAESDIAATTVATLESSVTSAVLVAAQAVARASAAAAAAAVAAASARAEAQVADTASAAAAAAVRSASQGSAGAAQPVGTAQAGGTARPAGTAAPVGAADGEGRPADLVGRAGTGGAQGRGRPNDLTSSAASAMTAATAALRLAVAAAASATASLEAARPVGRHLPSPRRNPASDAAARTGTAIVYNLLADVDEAVQTQWASTLADPMLPRFASQADPAGPELSLSSPGEQGLWRDISLAQRMVTVLRERELQFEAAFDDAPLAMMITSSRDGQPHELRRANAALGRLVGVHWADLHDLTMPDLAFPQGGSDTSGSGEGDPFSQGEVRRWRHADGHEIWVRLHCAPVRARAGSGGELVCQVTDLTAQRSADLTLRGSEKRFRLAFDGSPTATLLVELTGDAPGAVLAANSAACRLFGRDEAEILWLDLTGLTHPRDHSSVRATLTLLASGQLAHHDAEYRYPGTGGEVAWLTLTGHVVEDADGRPDHLLAYVRGQSDPVGDWPSRAPARSPRTSTRRTAPARRTASRLPESKELSAVDTAEQAACLLVRAVHGAGATVIPARLASTDALSIDISLGEGEPLLPVAPLGSIARATLERDLPALVEDCRRAVVRAR